MPAIISCSTALTKRVCELSWPQEVVGSRMYVMIEGDPESLRRCKSDGERPDMVTTLIHIPVNHDVWVQHSWKAQENTSDSVLSQP